MDSMALRAFTSKKGSRNIKSTQYSTEKKTRDFPRVLTFDAETTADKYQNLKFGYFDVKQNDIYIYGGLIWDKRHITRKEYNTLKKYANTHLMRLFSLEEFIKIFYLEVYDRGTLFLGFNINFDLSRIIQDYGYGKNSGKGGFSFTLTEDDRFPRIRIKQLNGKSYNVEFVSASKDPHKKCNFKGHFLDVQRLACILTDNKSLSLESACEIFDTQIKKKAEKEHGKVTPRYIEYNIKDVKATYQVFQKVREEFNKYQLNIPMTEVYSAASLGKQALRQCGIRSFSEQNPKFSRKIIGNIMGAYYGGRCEVKVRKTPVKVTVLDFFSMYPTVMLLLGHWDFLIAAKMGHKTDTKAVQEFIDGFTLEKALDKDSWKQMNVLVELRPDGDIFPVRTNYGDQDTRNIGINHITYKDSVYYFLPDVLASKLLTGKSPQIRKAIRFISEDVQKGLTKTQIYGIPIDPKKDNLVKHLVEHRQGIKNAMREVAKDSHDYDRLDSQQKAVKIVNNSTSYGIYLEVNPEEDVEELEIFSNANFDSIGKYEPPGVYFHPIIGANITAGSRLLLAIAERFVLDKGEVHTYMDTDSIFVPPHLAEELSHLFDPLNPYDFEKTILEIEDGMEDVWFYGISSKRYCLFNKDGNKIDIPDGKKLFYKLHGLGHITNPFSRELCEKDHWHKQIWLDILKVHYNPELLDGILEKYDNYSVISNLSITTANLHRRFKKVNEGKPFGERIKPFNFMLVGQGTISNKKGRSSAPIKPIAPFSKNPQEIVELPFIDYKSDNILQGRHYWKPLSDVFDNYISHPESKFEGSIGVLKRRHLKPKGCIYVGKESNNIDMQCLEQSQLETFYDLKALEEYILNLTPSKAKEMGISKTTLFSMKKRIKSQKLSLNTSAVKKVLEHFHNETESVCPEKRLLQAGYHMNDVINYVHNLTPKEARSIGIRYRSTLQNLKKKAEQEQLNLNSSMMDKVVTHLLNC
ncbi:DNA polymerase [Methanococcoides methylutens]|uniref:DNA-directed DNA polymerase n=1 Tax=Methanococcoides methylutens MM1 TaxID=1434104 RepID=A0A0E3X227_METMT|nr:DNA polymerase [Methanococcoides methylutens]AKB85834.1 hypothetical protein MCMEM_1781 [Methanococcoides methylutens MM1]